MDLIDEDLLIIAGTLLCSYMLLFKKKTRKIRSCKTRLVNRRRRCHGFYNSYFIQIKANDEKQFFKYTRMTVDSFNKLLNLVKPHLLKRKLPDSISPEERLAITLHYFSQGTSMQTIAWTYNIGHSTVHYILIETAKAIWEELSGTYLKPPTTEKQWLDIAQQFEEQWHFPNCIGALDGKHINIQAPAKSGSQFFNYKKTFSVILLACCDANYNFTLIDIGAYGSESDGGVFKNSVFGKLLEQNQLNVPSSRRLPNTDILYPFTMVADAAFPLKSYIMRPYPGRNLDAGKRIFNYRLSRARRVIENTFGILVNRWRLLRNMVTAKVDNIDIFVKAIVCLHNYVKMESLAANDLYCPPGFLDTDEHLGTWRSDVTPLESVGRLSANRAAYMVYNRRDILKDYFLSPVGQIPWQHKVLEEGSCGNVIDD